MRFAYLLFSLILCLSCVDSKEIINIVPPEETLNVDDSEFIIHQTFTKGDVRRYGVFPEQTISTNDFKNVLSLANQGLPIYFPAGYYNTSISLENTSNVTIKFDEVILAGHLQITNNSERIKINGSVTILDKLFIVQSRDISFEKVIVKSNQTQNIYEQKNRGVSIYAGSKNIKFDSLFISDTGATRDDFFKHTAASLQIHGWNDNPKNIQINKLEINNAGRTALYLTGQNHKLNNIKISNFGLGSNENMFGLDDAKTGEETVFSALWINKCNNCEIDSLDIYSAAPNKRGYSLRLDEGKYHEPTFINNIRMSGTAKQLPIFDDQLTNILVKNEY